MSRQHEDRGADALQEAANVAIQRVSRSSEGNTLIGENVACIKAKVGSNGSPERCCRVVIGGVAPGAMLFRMAVAYQLQRMGWPGVEVVTEW